MTGPRRQARGLARIEQILDAADALVGELGHEQVSMNEVARRAGISPGSLYQYFADRGELLGTLAMRYARRIEDVLPADAATAGIEDAELAELVDRFVDPVIRIGVEHQGFTALFHNGTPELAQAIRPVQESMIDRIRGMVAVRAPTLEPAHARRVAEVALRIVEGPVHLIAERPEPERGPMLAEFKLALRRYLEVYDEGPRRRGPHPG